jgi:hypothetical protein
MAEAPTLLVIPASDIPTLAPCCQAAHERGYRHGYRHGYRYALWDLGKALTIPDGLWHQIERFLADVLMPWVRRARDQADAPLRMELGPRFRKDPGRRRKGAA